MVELHPQIRALIDAVAGDPALDPTDLQALRAGYLRTAQELGGPAEEVAAVEDVSIARADGSALAVRAYTPQAPAQPPGALIWFHGGGWVMGDLDGFDHVARALANASGQVVISVDYRLAPEYPHPAAVDDGELAVRWAVGEGAVHLGFDGGRVAIGGDSAGGQVAVATALRIPQHVRAQLLVYPALDPQMNSEAYRQFAGGPMLTAGEMAAFWGAYRAGGEPSRAPGGPELATLPPAWVGIAGHDPLRDDGLAYAEMLWAAGVRAEVEVYQDMTHGFLRWGGAVDRAHELIAWLAGAARSAVGA